MAENDTKILSAQQRKAVEALMTHATVTAAAEAAGVTRKTIYRWKDQPEFVAALRQAERDATAELSRALQRLSRSAIQVLSDAMRPGEKMAHRLRGSEVTLSNFLRMREFHDFEEQLAELEAMDNA